MRPRPSRASPVPPRRATHHPRPSARKPSRAHPSPVSPRAIPDLHDAARCSCPPSILLQWHQPDIPVLDRVAVVLEVDRAGGAGVAAEAGAGVVDGDGDVVVDRDAVVADADPRGGDLLAIDALGGLEVDVVALPDGGGLAGVDAGPGHLVDGAAVVVLGIEAVAVEDLDLVAALEVDA